MALAKLATVPSAAQKIKAPKQSMPPQVPVDAMMPSNAGRSAQSTDAVNKYQ